MKWDDIKLVLLRWDLVEWDERDREILKCDQIVKNHKGT